MFLGSHITCFCHHVHSVYVSIMSTLGNWWQRLANVKSLLSPWLLRTFATVATVDAFWSVSTCNTQVFTLHAVTHMFVYRPPYLWSSSSPSSLLTRQSGLWPLPRIWDIFSPWVTSPSTQSEWHTFHHSQLYHWEDFPLQVLVCIKIIWRAVFFPHFYFLRFYLFIFWERGAEGEHKGENYWCERET